MADVTQPDGFNTHQAAGLWRGGGQLDLLWLCLSHWPLSKTSFSLYGLCFDIKDTHPLLSSWDVEEDMVTSGCRWLGSHSSSSSHVFECSMNFSSFNSQTFILCFHHCQLFLTVQGNTSCRACASGICTWMCYKEAPGLTLSLSALTWYFLQHEDLLKMCSFRVFSH